MKTVKTRQSLVDLVEISRDKSRGMDEEFLEALFAQLGATYNFNFTMFYLYDTSNL